jgi:hypothetical protein
VKFKIVPDKKQLFSTADLYDGKNMPELIDFLPVLAQRAFDLGATKKRLVEVEVFEFEAGDLQEAKKLENINAWALKHGLISLTKNEVRERERERMDFLQTHN